VGDFRGILDSIEYKLCPWERWLLAGKSYANQLNPYIFGYSKLCPLEAGVPREDLS